MSARTFSSETYTAKVELVSDCTFDRKAETGTDIFMGSAVQFAFGKIHPLVELDNARILPLTCLDFGGKRVTLRLSIYFTEKTFPTMSLFNHIPKNGRLQVYSTYVCKKAAKATSDLQ